MPAVLDPAATALVARVAFSDPVAPRGSAAGLVVASLVRAAGRSGWAGPSIRRNGAGTAAVRPRPLPGAAPMGLPPVVAVIEVAVVRRSRVASGELAASGAPANAAGRAVAALGIDSLVGAG